MKHAGPNRTDVNSEGRLCCLLEPREDANAGMRNGGLILLVSLLAVLPQGMLQGYTDYSFVGLISRGLDPQAYSSFVLALGLVGVAMNPLLLFLLVYVIGRSLDLKGEYLAVCSYLFLGAFVGGFTGRAAIYYISPAGANSFATAASIGVESIASAVSAVFVGFTAAAIAFIRRAGPSEEAQLAGKA